MQTASLLNGNRHTSYASSLPRSESQISIVPDQEPISDDSNTSLMAVIARAARDPSVNVDKMERLLAMHERMLDREAECAFNEAMHETQSEMMPIARDCYNKQTRSWFASLAAVDTAIRPIYSKHGFALSFDTDDSPKPDHVRVVCMVSRAGYKRRYHVDVAADGKGAKGGDVMTKTHAGAAANTYGQRYLTTLIFNISFINPEDDGNSAGGTTDTQPQASYEPEHVTPEQIKKLEAKIAEVGANKEIFLRYIKVDTLDCIYRNKFDAVMNVLDQKAKANAGGK